MKKSWSLAFQINHESTDTGRPAGGLMWVAWLTHIFGLTSQLALQVFTLHKSSHSLIRNLSHCILRLKKEFTAKSIERYPTQIWPGCICFF